MHATRPESPTSLVGPRHATTLPLWTAPSPSPSVAQLRTAPSGPPPLSSTSCATPATLSQRWSSLSASSARLCNDTPASSSLRLSESLWQLGDMRCSHEAEQHWIPPPNAAALSPPPRWPPRLCAVLALAVAELNLTSPSAISEARHIKTAPSSYHCGDNTTVLPPADHALLPSALLDINDELEVDVEVERASPYSTPSSFVNDSRDTSPFPWDEAPGADTDGEDDDPAHAPPHFFPISQRLPSRAGAPRLAPIPALAAAIDPRGHRQAMKAPEAAEWQAAELAKLQNHTANGSFREMNCDDARASLTPTVPTSTSRDVSGYTKQSATAVARRTYASTGPASRKASTMTRPTRRPCATCLSVFSLPSRLASGSSPVDTILSPPFSKAASSTMRLSS